VHWESSLHFFVFLLTKSLGGKLVCFLTNSFALPLFLRSSFFLVFLFSLKNFLQHFARTDLLAISFHSSKNIFILPLFLKGIFTGYRVVGRWLFLLVCHFWFHDFLWDTSHSNYCSLFVMCCFVCCFQDTLLYFWFSAVCLCLLG
jgi:hypothetical protein